MTPSWLGYWAVGGRQLGRASLPWQHLCSLPVSEGSPHEPPGAARYQGPPKQGTNLGSSTLVKATSGAPWEGRGSNSPQIRGLAEPC